MAQKLKQDMSIGTTIRRLRNVAGVTQEQVVAQMQVNGCTLSRSAYSQIERGTYSIRISALMTLRRIFGVEYADFFSDLP